MKNILSFLSFLIIICSTTGCSDYLDIKPRGTDVPRKLSHYEGLLYGSEFTSMYVYHYGTFEHTIDETGFTSFYSFERYNAAKAYQWQPDIFRSDDDCSEWNTPCAVFYTFNVVVNEVMDADDGTEEQKLAVQSEARFLRAWYTYMMAQFFGNPYDPATADTDLCVPIIKEASTVGSDFSRRTVREVYDYIVTEMTESLPYLPKRPAHYKRIFHGTGNAMLGKVHWMMGEYSKALPYLEAAKQITNNDNTKQLINLNNLIDSEYGEIMDYPTMAVSPEAVFGILSMTNLYTALAPMMLGTAHRTFRSDVIHEFFEDYDCRLAFFSGVDSWMSAYAYFSPDERYYTNMTNMITNEGISLPDIYLMYAECLARGGQLDNAKQVLRELRINRMPADKANVPSSVSNQNDLIKFTVTERFREHFGTGLNWYDMRRLWGDPLFEDLKQYYTRTDGTGTFTLTKERLTMQIPPSVMIWHPEYTQNQ